MTEGQVRELLRQTAERITLDGGITADMVTPLTAVEQRAVAVGLSLLLNERFERGIAAS